MENKKTIEELEQHLEIVVNALQLPLVSLLEEDKDINNIVANIELLTNELQGITDDYEQFDNQICIELGMLVNAFTAFTEVALPDNRNFDISAIELYSNLYILVGVLNRLSIKDGY